MDTLDQLKNDMIRMRQAGANNSNARKRLSAQIEAENIGDGATEGVNLDSETVEELLGM